MIQQRQNLRRVSRWRSIIDNHDCCHNSWTQRWHKDPSASRMTRSTSNRSSKSTLLFLGLLVFSCLILPTSTQTVGVDICACQPSTYEFILNFNLTCDDKNVQGPGINASACTITTDRDLNVTNKVPVSVSKIQVLELNQNLDIISTTPYEGEYTNGDVFRYTSVIATDKITRPEDVPRALQMTLAGRNANEEDLVNFWIIIFDNSCGIYPVVLEGEQIGWTIFVRAFPLAECLKNELLERRLGLHLLFLTLPTQY